MLKKTKILLPLFFVSILIFSLFSVNNVNAISYYNHIQNPSFLSVSNYIEDGGFESGLFNQGLLYGNWSIASNTPQFVATYHTGQYSMSMSSGDGVWYNLTSTYYILGADVEEFGCWYKTATNNDMEFWIYYSDGTNTYDNSLVTPTVWTYRDMTGYIEVNKIVVAFKFRGNSDQFHLDDVVFLVDDGGGQDDLGQYTTPWYRETKNPLYTVTSTDMSLVSDFGRLDNSSVCSKLYHKAYLRQSIRYLDTDYVHYVDGYFYSSYGSEIAVRCIIAYTDGTSSYKIENISANSTWEYINFGKSFININKYINKISFDVYSYISTTVYFDDVGLWASVEFGYTRFGYTLSPNPIVVSYTSFHAYQQVQYTMSCYLYNASGGLSENGTYQFSDNTGFTTGNFEDGIFSYVLTKRVSTQNFDEQITITIVLAEEVINFQISATWQYVEAEDGIGVAPTQVSNFMFLFIFIFVPSIFLAGILREVGIPLIGFISGLTIMTSLAQITGIIPLWFLFVMVLVVVLLILAMLRSGVH